MSSETVRVSIAEPPYEPFFGVAWLLLLLMLVAAPPAAQGQTFSVIHYFSGAADGGSPEGRITIDHAGSLYGTAYDGGTGRYGTAFKVSHQGSGWTFFPLFGFSGDDNGG